MRAKSANWLWTYFEWVELDSTLASDVHEPETFICANSAFVPRERTNLDPKPRLRLRSRVWTLSAAGNELVEYAIDRAHNELWAHAAATRPLLHEKILHEKQRASAESSCTCGVCTEHWHVHHTVLYVPYTATGAGAGVAIICFWISI